MPRCI